MLTTVRTVSGRRNRRRDGRLSPEREDRIRKDLSSGRRDKVESINRGISKERKRQENRETVRDRGHRLVPLYNQFSTLKPDTRITKAGKGAKAG